MSHIQRVLDKAQREGLMNRTSAQTPAETPARATGPASPLPAATAPNRAIGAPRVPGDAAMPHVPPAAAETARRAARPQERTTAGSTPDTPAAPAPVVPNPVPAAARELSPVAVSPMLVAGLAPGSSMAEQYRALRTRIGHVENGRRFRTLVVTSPAARDGKTITTLNLALSMGQEFHRKVLVVDADLRKGTLHKHLGLPASPGLSEVLSGEGALDEALVFIPQFNITVLPAGQRADQPAEMLGSGEMRRVVDVLATQFDRILFDTPPVTAVADVSVLGPLVDGVLIVVRAGRTTRPSIDRALREVQPAHVIGLVLNDVEEVSPYYQESGLSSPERGPGMGRVKLNPSGRRSAGKLT